MVFDQTEVMVGGGGGGCEHKGIILVLRGSCREIGADPGISKRGGRTPVKRSCPLIPD